jgi:hypothetical protein
MILVGEKNEGTVNTHCVQPAFRLLSKQGLVHITRELLKEVCKKVTMILSTKDMVNVPSRDAVNPISVDCIITYPRM